MSPKGNKLEQVGGAGKLDQDIKVAAFPLFSPYTGAKKAERFHLVALAQFGELLTQYASELPSFAL